MRQSAEAEQARLAVRRSELDDRLTQVKAEERRLLEQTRDASSGRLPNSRGRSAWRQRNCAS